MAKKEETASVDQPEAVREAEAPTTPEEAKEDNTAQAIAIVN